MNYKDIVIITVIMFLNLILLFLRLNADHYNLNFKFNSISLDANQNNGIKDSNFGTKNVIKEAEKKEVSIKHPQIINDCITFSENEFFDKYRSYKEINCYLNQLKEENDMAYIEDIGKSVEGRTLYSFVISSDPINEKVFYFNAGLHAREWISPMSVIYIIKELLNNDKYKIYLSKYKIVFTPLSNPDGYEYSRTKNRLWRKNRKDNEDGTYGVDLNRNFNDHYGLVGYSISTSAEDYKGESAESEPEVKALSEYLIKFKGNMMAGVDYHSYGQKILRSRGYTLESSKNEEKLLKLSKYIQKQILRQNKQAYSIDKSAGLYPAGGALDDWLNDELKTVSFTIELCPISGGIGFKYPESKILNCAKGALTSAVSLIKYLDKNGQFPPND